MKKAHEAYLKKVISLISEGDTSGVGALRSPSSPEYGLIREIACDVRFYTVMDDHPFWRDYSSAAVSDFIDGLTGEDWQDNRRRTDKRETFLNGWLADNILPLTEQEQQAKIEALQARGRRRANPKGDEIEIDALKKPEDDEPEFGFGIKDMTSANIEEGEGLPSTLKPLMDSVEAADKDNAGSDMDEAEMRFMERVDQDMIELAKLIGRCGTGADENIGRFHNTRRSDITGITVGTDLNSLLPSELVLLSSAETEGVFFHRYAQKRLQLFSSASHSVREAKEPKGPIYICIDTSGSMEGEREALAKTLAMTIALVARRENRTLLIVNYSHTLSFFVLKDYRLQKQAFLRFLSRSYSGGNDENKLFNFLFKRLPESSVYRRFAERLKGADLLVISDFLWRPIDQKVQALIDHARSEGMLIYSLSVSGQSHNPFYLASDGRYIHTGSSLKPDI